VYSQNWALSYPHDSFGHGTQEQMSQSSVSVRGDDDQIRFQFLRRVGDHLIGSPEMHLGAALAVTLSSAFL
jgi:hypothetical protein